MKRHEMIKLLDSREGQYVLLENGYDFESEFGLMSDEKLNEIYHDYYCDEPCMYEEGRIS